MGCGVKFWETDKVDVDQGSVTLKSKKGDRSVTAKATEAQAGDGRWAKAEDEAFKGTQFEATLDLTGLVGKSLSVIVRAKVDSSWGKEAGVVFDGSTKPESHFVNARTNKGWRKENAGKVVEGRLEWFSGVMNIGWGEAGAEIRDAGVVGSKVAFDESALALPTDWNGGDSDEDGENIYDDPTIYADNEASR